jgi:hypothetical protein
MSERDEAHGTEEGKDEVEAHGGGTWGGVNEEPRPEDEPSEDVEAHGGGTWGG